MIRKKFNAVLHQLEAGYASAYRDSGLDWNHWFNDVNQKL